VVAAAAGVLGLSEPLLTPGGTVSVLAVGVVGVAVAGVVEAGAGELGAGVP
jgi:hypothetical protein